MFEFISSTYNYLFGKSDIDYYDNVMKTYVGGEGYNNLNNFIKQQKIKNMYKADFIYNKIILKELNDKFSNKFNDKNNKNNMINKLYNGHDDTIFNIYSSNKYEIEIYDEKIEIYNILDEYKPQIHNYLMKTHFLDPKSYNHTLKLLKDKINDTKTFNKEICNNFSNMINKYNKEYNYKFKIISHCEDDSASNMYIGLKLD